tara:strand:- start:337 stop:600 length:264 start_codon:yes stop_codon:yes gene_type:complete
MNYYVYLLISYHKNKYYTYVGYTNNLKKRLTLHNNSKGAKYTKGKKWSIIFRKAYKTKSLAMKNEIKFKNNRKERNIIKLNYINNKL